MSGDIHVTLSYEERILNALAHVEYRRGASRLERDVRDAAAIREVLAPLRAEFDEARDNDAQSRQMLAQQCDLARDAEARAEAARRNVVGVYCVLRDAGLIAFPVDGDEDLAEHVRTVVAERDDARTTLSEREGALAAIAELVGSSWLPEMWADRVVSGVERVCGERDALRQALDAATVALAAIAGPLNSDGWTRVPAANALAIVRDALAATTPTGGAK